MVTQSTKNIGMGIRHESNFPARMGKEEEIERKGVRGKVCFFSRSCGVGYGMLCVVVVVVVVAVVVVAAPERLGQGPLFESHVGSIRRFAVHKTMKQRGQLREKEREASSGRGGGYDGWWQTDR